MSLFTAALGGAGRAAGQMAEAYIKDELTRNAVADLERIRAENEERKARLINELGMRRDAAAQSARAAADREIADYKVSPGYVALAADAAGKIKAAETDATGYTLNPGEQRRRGSDLVAENQRPTGAEASLTALREGGKTKDVDWDKLIKPEFFKDETTGAVDHRTRASAVQIAKMVRLIGGMDAPEAARTALALIDKARQEAGGNADRFAEEMAKIEQAIREPRAPATATQTQTPQGEPTRRRSYDADLAARRGPQSTLGMNYGPLTPWSDVEAGLDAGDPAALHYARQWLEKDARGGHAVKINMPQSLLDKVNAMLQSEARAAARN